MKNHAYKKIMVTIFIVTIVLKGIQFALHWNDLVLYVGESSLQGGSFLVTILLFLSLGGILFSREQDRVIRFVIVFVIGLFLSVASLNYIASNSDVRYYSFTAPDGSTFVARETAYTEIYQKTNGLPFMKKLAIVKGDDGIRFFSQKAYRTEWIGKDTLRFYKIDDGSTDYIEITYEPAK